MELKMNNIKKDIDNLFDKITKEDIYKNYISSKKQLNNNKEIIEIINKIKEYQVKITNNYSDKLEAEIKELYNKLNSYPLYQSYIEYKEELNNMLANITKEFNLYFEDILELNL